VATTSRHCPHLIAFDGHGDAFLQWLSRIQRSSSPFVGKSPAANRGTGDLYRIPLRSPLPSFSSASSLSSPTANRSNVAPAKPSAPRWHVSRPKPPSKSSALEISHEPPVVQGIRLVPTSELRGRLRSLFPFPIFNAVQSKCFPVAFNSNDNIVLSAPTGSGKTVVMELAICRLMTFHTHQQFKIVYQAPTKSLCAERYRDWQAKFGTLDLQCAELTGDTDYDQLKSIQNATIIITTPEKWDSVTRKWKDHAKLMQLVKLFLIDEVHVLKDSRGATLEAVVSRMKSVGSSVRFVALSATVPNSEDIATWLGKSTAAQHLPAHREVFGEEFRPVKLQKFVYGYDIPQNDFVFDNILTDKYVSSTVSSYKS
jgi:ATP-dependent DNA helicase HFM1/MER3